MLQGKKLIIFVNVATAPQWARAF